MLLLFGSRSGASADDPNPVIPIGMHHHNETLRWRHPDGNEPRLVRRVQRVWNGSGEGIPEHCRGLLERDAVAPKIGGGLDFLQADRLRRMADLLG